jgi:hypothetical protein
MFVVAADDEPTPMTKRVAATTLTVTATGTAVSTDRRPGTTS